MVVAPPPPIATAALHLLLSRPSLTAAQLRQIHAQLLTSSLLADHFFPNSLLRSLLPASPHRALRLFPRLRRITANTNPLFPNAYTFSFLFTASASLAPRSTPHASFVSSLHGLAVLLSFDAHAYVSNGLIHAYSSCGLLSSARRVFDLNVSCRDVCSWTSLLTAYGRAARLDDARDLFDAMPDKTTVAWGAMLSAYVGNGSFAEAVEVFQEMLRARVRPNRAAILSVLAACGALGALEQGRWVHAMVAGAGAMAKDGMVATALIDMYGKCGSLDTARQVFAGMAAERDVFAYTAMITALSDHGRCAEAIELFGRMQEQGVRPNEVTFICVLSACGRAGLVGRAREIFGSMAAAYGMHPGVEHYGSMVDVLGRAGMVEEAVEVVRAMPMRPDSYVMGALMNACVARGDTEAGKEVAARLAELGLFDGSSGAQVQLSNLYAGRGKWEEVVSVRRGMEERKVVKVPGCSMVEVDGVAREFVAGDRSQEAWIMDVAAHLRMLAHH